MKPDQLEANDYRRQSPRFQQGNVEQNLQLRQRLEQIAKEKGITVAQLSLAWLLHQGDDIVPIPGTKHIKYLEQNIAAVDVKLTPGDLKRIGEVAPAGAFAGARYVPAAMERVHK
jgi:aryl-alcohol dehydrogenase-like predicted oxidoreductase